MTRDPLRPRYRLAAPRWWARGAWVAILAGAGAFELRGVFNHTDGDTLSETTRWMFRVNTPAGAWAFRVAWAAFTWWFGPHIVRLTVRPRDAGPLHGPHK